MPDKLRVLYVDDEPGLLEIGKLFLEESGRFSVDIITSAPAALTFLDATKYDAIISDYQMPGMDGIQFLKSVRASGNAIPFILFTGKGREEIVIQALNEGANFYLQKGGEPEAQFAELVHKIQISVEHHRAAEKIRALNRLYSVLSATNKAIFSIQTRDEFFSEICRILVETGGFRMAWIGLADLEQKIIRPVASAGHVAGYLDTIHISTEDVPEGRGPTGTAFREGKYFWSNDITLDPRMEPWRENALKRGYFANAAFSFALGTKNAGTLSVYAPVTGFFDPAIIDLLEELAVDISFYLRAIDDHDERTLAINARRVSEERFHGLFDTINSGVAIYEVRNEGKSGKDYIIKDFNKIALEIEGKKKDEVIGKSLFDLRPTIDEYGLIPVFRKVWETGDPGFFPQKVYIDEKFSNWYENRVFRLQSGEIVAVYDDVTERKQVEADRLASEEALSAMLNGITESAFLMTPEGTVVAANQTVARRLGMKQAKDLIGQNALSLLPEDVQMRRRIKIKEVIQSGQPVHFEDVRMGRVISQTIYPVKDPDGTVRRLAIFGVDVTDRKLTEDALEETSKRLSFALRSAKSGTWDWDFPTGQLVWSPEFFELFGLPTEVTPSFETWLAALHPDDRKPAMEKIDQSVKEHRDLWNEYRVLLPDGSVRWIGASGSTAYNDSGEPLRMSGVCIDITERKQADEALQESRRQLNSMAANVPGVVYRFYANPDGTTGFDYINERSLQVLGLENDTATFEDRFISGMGPEDQERYHTTVLEAINSKSLWEFESWYVKPSGKRIWISSISSPVMEKDRLLFDGVAFDNTDRKRIEEELLRKNMELNASYEQVAASEEELRSNYNELSRQEQALRESEERFRALIQNSTDIIRIISRDGSIVFDSPSSSRILGYPPDFTIGKSPLEFIHPDDQKLVQDALGEVYTQTHPGIPTEFRIRNADGDYLYVETIGTNLIGVPGVDGIVTTTRVIEERKKYDATLKKSEERFRGITERISDLIIIADPVGKPTYVSPSVQSILGFPPDYYIGVGANPDIFPHEDVMKLSLAMKRLMEGSPEERVEFRMKKSDGTYAIFDGIGKPVFEEGSYAGVQVVARDITLQKQAEQSLRIQHDLSLELNNCNSLGDACNLILSATLQIEGLEAGGIYIADPGTGDLDLIVSHGLSSGFTALASHIGADSPQVRWAEAGMPYYGKFSETRNDEGDKIRESEGITTVACIPVMYEGRLISLLNVASHSLDQIPESSRQILETLAIQVGSTFNRIHSQVMLRAGEERYRSLIENLNDVVFTVDQDGSITYASPVGERQYGYSSADLIGKPFTTVVFPDDVPALLKRFHEISQGIIAPFEWRLVHKDGSISWVRTSTRPVADSTGPPRFSGIISDISREKQAEEMVRQANERFRSFVDANIVGVIIASATGSIIYTNDYYLQMLGYTREEFEQGMVNWRTATPPEWLPADEHALEELRQHGKCIPYEKEYFRRDGTRVSALLSDAMLPTHKEQIIAFAIDITDRKRADEAIRQANRKLKILTGITRHDINNQLLVLNGYLMLLQKKASDQAFEDLLPRIMKASSRISSMIQFAREYEEIGVNAPAWQECHALVDIVAKEAPLGQFALKNDLSAGVEVFADPLITKVFYNLMDNAVRHGGKITTIRFSATERDDILVVICEDDGNGIPPDDKEKIFERGFGKNTGLGLALSREILDITGITIRETGELGKGARFEIVVPKGMYR